MNFNETNVSNRGMKCVAIIALLLIGCLLIGCFAVLGGSTDNLEYDDQNGSCEGEYESFVSDFTPGKENKNGNTYANLCNEGIASEQDGWIYYCVKEKNGNGAISSLYKERNEGGDRFLLWTFNGVISRISVCEDYIYFLQNKTLNRIRTDGNCYEELFTDDDSVGKTNYMIVNKYLYMTKSEKISSRVSKHAIVRYKLDNFDSHETVYVPESNEVYYGVTNDFIILKIASQSYVKDKLIVYNMKTNEKKSHELPTEKHCFFSNIQLVDNCVYYTVETTYIVKVNLITMESTIAEYEVGFNKNAINIINENNVYTTIGTGLLGKAAYIGKQSFDLIERGSYYEIIEDRAFYMCIVGDWIYYSTDYSQSDYCRVKTNGESWEMLYEYPS